MSSKDTLAIRFRDVVGLAIISIFSTAISATIDTITLILPGGGNWDVFGSICSTWSIGDSLGRLLLL